MDAPYKQIKRKTVGMEHVWKQSPELVLYNLLTFIQGKACKAVPLGFLVRESLFVILFFC